MFSSGVAVMGATHCVSVCLCMCVFVRYFLCFFCLFHSLCLSHISVPITRLQVSSAKGGRGGDQPPEVFCAPGDVSDAEAMEEMIKSVVAALGGLDIVVLNAGFSFEMPFAECAASPTHMQTLSDMMDVNFWSNITLTRLLLPHLRASHGSLIVTSSIASIAMPPRRAVYAASKAAMNAFFVGLDREEKDVSVTVACPGFVVTDIHDRMFKRRGKGEKVSVLCVCVCVCVFVCVCVLPCCVVGVVYFV
jgi:NAD(P)-dependent dehydrogenase (short-subunit alcohol dehydrogenase family)